MDRAQWFFGSKNNMSIYLCFTLSIILISLYIEKEIKKRWVFTRFVFFSALAFFPALMCGTDGIAFMEGSSSGIVAVAVLIGLGFYIIFVQNKNNKIMQRLVRPNIMLTVVLGFYAVTVFGSVLWINTFVSGLLGKELTFSGRVGVWQSALLYIRQAFLTGYGEREIMLYLSLGRTTSYVYNCLLKLTLNYGFIGLLLFISTLYFMVKIKNDNILSSLVMLCVSSVLIVGMMNEVNLFFIISLSSVSYYLSENETMLTGGE